MVRASLGIVYQGKSDRLVNGCGWGASLDVE
ncbi:hypothetical protein FRIGORI9N_100099 [Frigoribacterium sp. 9N]|nr:hypothetical protein FRIGORI9N_100099 [Frigoribacterium sp. 9N]